MAPRVDPVVSDGEVPARTGVVVVGGGIIGTSTAFFLARKGIPVVLCEKGHIAGEQSSRNWGWCRKMGRDPREIPLAIEALRLWPEMNALTEAETGFRQCGIVYLCKTAEDVAKREAWLEEARPYQLDTPDAVARRGGGGAARSDGRLAGRALHAERRPRRAAEGRAGDRGGGAAAWRHDAAAMRGARHRDSGRAGCSRGDREGAHRLRQRRARRRGLVAVVLRQPRPAPAAAQGDVVGDAHRDVRCAGRRHHAAASASAYASGSTAATTWQAGAATWSTSCPTRSASSPTSCLRCACNGATCGCAIGGKFLEEWQVPRHWALDAASPFERVRTLDPEPYQPILDQARSTSPPHSRRSAT